MRKHVCVVAYACGSVHLIAGGMYDCPPGVLLHLAYTSCPGVIRAPIEESILHKEEVPKLESNKKTLVLLAVQHRGG